MDMNYRFMRKAPRIISRKRKPPPPSTISSNTEIDDDIGEGVIVHRGVMMQLIDNENHIGPVQTSDFPQQLSRRITVDNSSCLKESHIEKPLPGIADEIESYPCRYCADRVFLTPFGLEKHTKALHCEHLDKVFKQITKIHNEWRRRECERGRHKELTALAKIKQEALKDVFGRKTASCSNVIQNEESEESCDEYEIDPNIRRTYDPCRICGILINILHPSAMINHMRAHTKNDELRNQLLAEYGVEYVERVTCNECQLVFSDENKLLAHTEFTHARKRKYICKWCGHLCQSMGLLNAHKADVHGMPSTRFRERMRKLNRRKAVGETAGSSVAFRNAKGISCAPSGKLSSSVNDAPCRTACEFCDLIMVKPSLLIRHMLRVHNRSIFTAVIEMKKTPPVKVEVDNGRLTWLCCESSYYDRQSFIYHRKTAHQTKYDGVKTNNIPRDMIMDERRNAASLSANEQKDLVLGDSVQILDQGPNSSSENVFVLLVANSENSEACEKQDCWESVSQGIPQGMHQIALTAEQYEQLRLQIDGDLNNMQVLFMDEDEETQNSVATNEFMSIEPLLSTITESGALNNAFSLNSQNDQTVRSPVITNIPVPGISITVHDSQASNALST